MRSKTGVIALALLSALFLGGTALFYSKYQKSEANVAQLTAQEQETRIRYSQAIGEIATIQDSLNTIVLGEAPMIPGGAQSEVNLPASSREQVLSRIATLKAGLERTKERIQDLDDRLKRNGVKIAGLQKMIGGLKRTVTEKEEQIATLNTQVASLNTQVAGLSTEVETKTQEIQTKNEELTTKQHELATIFYTIGKKKDLTKSGVVVAQGGVLGMGKTLKVSGTVNEAAFTPLDTDQQQVIRIPAKKAVVISPQPTSSYTLMATGPDVMELHIVDAKEFRKVKHLVIVTT